MPELDGEIFGFVGKRGKGKTLVALQIALRLADDLDKDLCFNFTIDGRGFAKYCKACGYRNLLQRFYRGGVRVRGTSCGLDLWMAEQDTIYVLDEASIWCDARNWAKLPEQFKQELSYCRHTGKILFCIAQNYQEVDSRLRNQTNMVIICDGFTTRDKQTGIKQMKLKVCLGYQTEGYEQIPSKKTRWSGTKMLIQKLLKAQFRFISFLDYYDQLLFKVYNSFDRDLFSNEPVMSNPPYQLKVLRFKRISYSEAEFQKKLEASR